jgi:hypothetical protein
VAHRSPLGGCIETFVLDRDRLGDLSGRCYNHTSQSPSCDLAGGRLSRSTCPKRSSVIHPGNTRPTPLEGWYLRDFFRPEIYAPKRTRPLGLCDNGLETGSEGARDVATKVRVTEEGLLIPKEVTDRALGEGLEEVEILEEDGRLVVAAAEKVGDRATVETPADEDPILGLGRNPVRTGARDGSTEHDRYLYGAGG